MYADETLTRIAEGVDLHHRRGEPEAARLLWDLRALTAAGLITDDQVARVGVPMSVAGLYPSLHLNLSECYRRLGDLDRAREHLRQARATIGALGDDDYGRLIRNGLNRLEELLAG